MDTKLNALIEQFLSNKIEPPHENSSFSFEEIYSDDRTVFKITVHDDDRFYILKVRGENAIKEEDFTSDGVTKEFNQLKSAYDSFIQSPNNLHISKPLEIFKEENAMLMEGCHGQNFKDYYLRRIAIWPLFNGQLYKRLELCGNWLSTFHKNSSVSNKCADMKENRFHHLDRMLTAIEPRFSELSINLDTQVIKKHYSYLTPIHTPTNIGLLHGNYSFRNILITDDNIAAIDFEDSRTDCISYDIGQFISEIIIKGDFPLITNKLIHSQIREFLHAYNNNFPINAHEVSAYIGYHLVANLYEILSRKNANLPIRLIQRHRITHIIRWIKLCVSGSTIYNIA
jgi:thiamine kinase-like enzyme